MYCADTTNICLEYGKLDNDWVFAVLIRLRGESLHYDLHLRSFDADLHSFLRPSLGQNQYDIVYHISYPLM